MSTLSPFLAPALVLNLFQDNRRRKKTDLNRGGYLEGEMRKKKRSRINR
jgi:hypothetical protein